MTAITRDRSACVAPRRACRAIACRNAGFTLPELMVTLTVVGVIGVIALPPFKNLIDNQNIKAGASDLHSALLYARSEALKRAADVDVIPTAGDWKKGWSVQLGAAVLRKQAALNTQLDAIPIGSGTKVTYQNDGRVVSAPDAAVFRISNNAQAVARCVSVDLSGRPVVAADANGDPTDGCN